MHVQTFEDKADIKLYAADMERVALGHMIEFKGGWRMLHPDGGLIENRTDGFLFPHTAVFVLSAANSPQLGMSYASARYALFDPLFKAVLIVSGVSVEDIYETG